ncbi:MAG: hypothetical protein IKY83_03980 [Proteobacteria bacterium]|nr:hypothetical protein [Pseudomonadota bacterium]
MNAFLKTSAAVTLTAAFLASLPSCVSEDLWAPEALTIRLFELADGLDALDDCAPKHRLMEAWLGQNAQKLEQDKKKFDRACAVTQRESVMCMSYQILASAQIEVALRSCVSEAAALHDDIDRLNALAGTAILTTHRVNP